MRECYYWSISMQGLQRHKTGPSQLESRAPEKAEVLVGILGYQGLLWERGHHSRGLMETQECFRETLAFNLSMAKEQPMSRLPCHSRQQEFLLYINAIKLLLLWKFLTKLKGLDWLNYWFYCVFAFRNKRLFAITVTAHIYTTFMDFENEIAAWWTVCMYVSVYLLVFFSKVWSW